MPLHRCARGYLWCWQTSSLQQCLRCAQKWLRRGQSKLAAFKTLAIQVRSSLAAHCSSSRSFEGSPQPARLGPKASSTWHYRLLPVRRLGGAAHFAALSMPEHFDDEDEVGTGLYVLIGCAAVTVVLMYSWIGYTLYQGFKARRKVD